MVDIISGGVIGAMLLLSLLLRFVDGAVRLRRLSKGGEPDVVYRRLEGRNEIFSAK